MTKSAWFPPVGRRVTVAAEWSSVLVCLMAGPDASSRKPRELLLMTEGVA